MALLHIPLDDITEANLQALIENGVRESLYIDYKCKTYGGKDEEKKEFLADICSFANAAGGDIVIGMAEGDGVATDIVPFEKNADDELRRLEQMARDGIEPRIIGLRIHVVAVGGGVVFIVRVPKSYNPPHRVTYKGSSRFYARTSGGKYEPNVEQLRNLFLAAPHLQERIRAFRMERIARIAAGETPVPLRSDTPRRAVLHIVPYSAFGAFDPDLIRKFGKNRTWFPPFGCNMVNDLRVNFDGLLTLSNGDKGAVEHASYCQAFRNGSVETIMSFGDDGIANDPVIGSMFIARNMTDKLICSVFRLTSALHRSDVGPPYVVMFSLLGMKSITLGVPGAEQTADRDQYHFIEAQLDSAPDSTEAAAKPLRPLLDHVASLSGAISLQ